MYTAFADYVPIVHTIFIHLSTSIYVETVLLLLEHGKTLILPMHFAICLHLTLADVHKSDISYTTSKLEHFHSAVR